MTGKLKMLGGLVIHANPLYKPALPYSSMPERENMVYFSYLSTQARQHGLQHPLQGLDRD